jgi:hypothetical protein
MAKKQVEVLPAKLIRQLGTMPDAEIAKSIGVSLGTVALHRRRLGIKPFRRSATDDRR